MSESLKKLKEIPVVNKVMQELDRALGVKDKVLAEFVLDVAKKSKNVSHFEQQLIEYEAEFSIELVNKIFKKQKIESVSKSDIVPDSNVDSDYINLNKSKKNPATQKVDTDAILKEEE